MIEQVMEHHRPLSMVARPTGQRPDLFVQLLDQALLMGGNNVHAAGLSRSR